ncbi:hypothetical protein FACS189430_10320 [Bacteroidia bacterium]|nr:hypothetical protein FACS189430_10320 [Bacteroidia bacterium]
MIGPEGAHLNISGISGLASKTSYAMFLLKSIQQGYVKDVENESVAFVFLNVKGRDLLAIDQTDEELPENDKKMYEELGIETKPFENVKFFLSIFKRYKINNLCGYYRCTKSARTKKRVSIQISV